MDNLCHTLVGAALAESGLKRRTVLGSATLMIGANFPDIDVIAVPLGHSLGFRRGITHGIPALIVLPFVLTGFMLLWHRWRGRRGDPRPRAGALLFLSVVSMLTHPILDWMNTYGMRWFLPFSGTWSYIDVLFIIDPWIWAALLLGVIWSRRRGRAPSGAHSRGVRETRWITRPARMTAMAVVAYVASMAALSALSRRDVAQALRARGVDVASLMVGPAPINPLRREVVYEAAGEYVFAEHHWRRSPRLSEDQGRVARNIDDPLAHAAAQTAAGAEFLSWSRLPFYSIARGTDSAVVEIADARYAAGTRGAWATVRVVVPLR